MEPIKEDQAVVYRHVFITSLCTRAPTKKDIEYLKKKDTEANKYHCELISCKICDKKVYNQRCMVACQSKMVLSTIESFFQCHWALICLNCVDALM